MLAQSDKPIMSPANLAEKIKRLPAPAPITTAFERALAKRGILDLDRAWYRSQKEHWLGWLAEYSGAGAYGRKGRGRDAAFAYNHIVCAPMLLWLAEAGGVSKSSVLAAQRAALQGSQSLQSMSAAIRRVIPFAAVAAMLTARRK